MSKTKKELLEDIKILKHNLSNSQFTENMGYQNSLKIIEQKDARIAELEEDLKMIAKQDAHQEHMENLELKQKIKELEGALLKAVDSFLQYEKGENIKFTKEELQTKAKEFTNFSISLDNKRIAELEKQLDIRDRALEIACDKIKEFCQNINTKCCRDYNCKFENNGCNYNDKINCSKLFIEQAEKELKGEK